MKEKRREKGKKKNNIRTALLSRIRKGKSQDVWRNNLMEEEELRSGLKTPKERGCHSKS